MILLPNEVIEEIEEEELKLPNSDFLTIDDKDCYQTKLFKN